MPEDLLEEIKKVATKIPGCCYVSVVGYDGLAVGQHLIEPAMEVNLYDAEISSLMLTSREIKENLGLGAEREIIWLTDNYFFILYPIGNDFFIYACLKPVGSNPGVARIELNKARKTFNQILYPEK